MTQESAMLWAAGIGVIGVIGGTCVGFVGQIIASKLNHKRELHKIIFEIKLGAYAKLLEVVEKFKHDTDLFFHIFKGQYDYNSEIFAEMAQHGSSKRFIIGEEIYQQYRKTIMADKWKEYKERYEKLNENQKDSFIHEIHKEFDNEYKTLSEMIYKVIEKNSR